MVPASLCHDSFRCLQVLSIGESQIEIYLENVSQQSYYTRSSPDYRKDWKRRLQAGITTFSRDPPCLPYISA